MITNNILIDSKTEQKVEGARYSYILESPFSNNSKNHMKKNEKKVKPILFEKGGTIGFILVVLEMVGVSFAILTGVVIKSIQLESWAVFIGCMLGLILVIWALSKLPNRAKKLIKIAYIRIQVFVFMVVIGSGGYLMSRYFKVENIGEVIIYTLVTAIPAAFTHLPYLRKRNIDYM